MAAPVNWRIKGVDKETQQMAAEAAARHGLTVAEWLERAIDSHVGVLPPEDEAPLAPVSLLESARAQVTEEKTDDQDTGDSNGVDRAPDLATGPDTPDDAAPPAPPVLLTRPKNRRRQVPKVSPILIAAESRRSAGNLPRILGGLLFVALLVGAYWLVDQNAKKKMAAENEAAAGRSATMSSLREAEKPGDNEGGQQPVQEEAQPEQPVVFTPLQSLTASANNGDARAQYDLGLMYLQGNGVDRNPGQAAGWLEKSANSGMPNAQYEVALLYQQGLGVRRNMKSAHRWFQKAAQQGHVRAQYELGTLYAEGKGTRRDYAEAARWFSRASREGLAEAHYSLGQIYENGLGVDRDQRKAAAYYRSALAAGSTLAAGKLARLEPALKELSRKNDAAKLESELTVAAPEGDQTPAKDRPLSAAGIRNLQQLLKKLDLEPGPQDGVAGSKTIEAIKLYQRFAGLPVDGKPTLELLLDLRQVVGAMSAERPAAGVPTEVR